MADKKPKYITEFKRTIGITMDMGNPNFTFFEEAPKELLKKLMENTGYTDRWSNLREFFCEPEGLYFDLNMPHSDMESFRIDFREEPKKQQGQYNPPDRSKNDACRVIFEFTFTRDKAVLVRSEACTVCNTQMARYREYANAAPCPACYDRFWIESDTWVYALAKPVLTPLLADLFDFS